MPKELDVQMIQTLRDRGFSNYQIAEQFEVHEKTIRNRLKPAKSKAFFEDLKTKYNLQLDTPLELDIPGEGIVLTADWHIPLFDHDYANEMMRATVDKHKAIIIAGDFFNFDALSAYSPKQMGTIEDELAAGREILGGLNKYFDDIYFLWGNHDDRLVRALGFSIQFEEAMKLALGDTLEGVATFTNLDHMWLQGEEDRIYVCHPKAYSRLPLSGPIRLSDKYRSSVVCAHSHHCAIGHAVDGRSLVMEAGGLFDKNVTAYLQRSTTFPTWQQGYSVVYPDRVELRSPRFTAGLSLG
jgi:hypothetical protein